MQELATDVRGGEIAHCGHWLPEEQPDTVAREMLNFFAKPPERKYSIEPQV